MKKVFFYILYWSVTALALFVIHIVLFAFERELNTHSVKLGGVFINTIDGVMFSYADL